MFQASKNDVYGICHSMKKGNFPSFWRGCRSVIPSGSTEGLEFRVGSMGGVAWFVNCPFGCMECDIP